MSATPSATVTAARPIPPTHVVWLAIYVAVTVGKFSEWVPGLASIPLGKIAILFTALFAWRARFALATVRVRSLPIARVALAFLALSVISIVYSVYKSSSLADIYGIVIYIFSVVLLLKITQNDGDVERLLFALCVAAAGLALAVLVTYSGGRARINHNFDSNDIAYGLVTTLPIVRALAATGRLGRLMSQGLTVVMILATLLTGSRGGAIALATVMFLLAAFPLGYDASGALKGFRTGRVVALAGVIVVLGATLWGYLPQESRNQLATLVDLEHDYNAGSSRNGRSAIWKRDVAVVLSRPIGYGLGSSEYVNGMAGGGYRSTHNSFVQALVELGVPGFVLLCSSYLIVLRQLGRVSGMAWRRAPPGRLVKACLYARALRIAVTGNLVAGFFLSQAYSELLWTLVAICAALVRISLTPEGSPIGATARRRDT